MLEARRIYYAVLSMRACPTDGLDEATDALKGAFLDDPTVSDVDITTSPVDGTLDVAMHVAAMSNTEAINAAIEAFDIAVHIAGDSTDKWEQRVDDEQYEASVRPVDLVPM